MPTQRAFIQKRIGCSVFFIVVKFGQQFFLRFTFILFSSNFEPQKQDMLRDLILKNRSYRRFNNQIKLRPEQIETWIDLARFTASGRNMQPLKYAVVTHPLLCEKVFPLLGWAGYLNDWKGPEEQEQPVAYVMVLNDKTISENHYCDDGIAMQSILLAAVEDGFGGCIIGSVNKSKVARLLELPSHLELLWVIALGKPAEEVVIEPALDDIRYWRDEEGTHHVPKRALTEVLIFTK